MEWRYTGRLSFERESSTDTKPHKIKKTGLLKTHPEVEEEVEFPSNNPLELLGVVGENRE